jgi:hypothetical protein
MHIFKNCWNLLISNLISLNRCNLKNPDIIWYNYYFHYITQKPDPFNEVCNAKSQGCRWVKLHHAMKQVFFCCPCTVDSSWCWSWSLFEGHQAKRLKMSVIIIYVFSQAYENFYYCILEVTGVKFGQLTNNTAIFNWFSQPLKASAQSSLSNSMLVIILCTHSTLHKTLALQTVVLKEHKN